jgi:monoamine oxidase
MDSRDEHVANPTRRDVITTAGAAGVIAGVDALLGSSQAQSGKPPHVVIVGAGLAGLCAAYRLQQRGWTYTILEADQYHVGGRVRTLRFKNGTYAELGAMRIPTKHDITLRYVDEFKLKRREFVMDNPATYFFVRNRLERRSDLEKIRQAYDLQPSERKPPEDLWAQAIVERHGLLDGEKEDLKTSNSFTTDKINKLDRLSMRRALEKAGLSEEALEYIFVLMGVGTLQHSALTEHLREELYEIWTLPFFEIENGTEELPRAFRSKLRSEIRMGHEVTALRQDENSATAIYRTANRTDIVKGDFLLCTVPLPVLARFEIEGRFSDAKKRAVRDVFYESGTKVVVPTTTRFWETDDKIFGGSSYTDLMTGPIFYPSDNSRKKEGATGKEREAIDPAKSKAPAVLVASYTWGQEARRLGNMTASQREEHTIRLVSQVHKQLLKPGIVLRDQVKSWSWDNHRWAGGAFAFYMPGQFAALHRHVIAPEGRIYFAGEHCSRSHTWMQGALESAEQAVDTIIARAG